MLATHVIKYILLKLLKQCHPAVAPPVENDIKKLQLNYNRLTHLTKAAILPIYPHRITVIETHNLYVSRFKFLMEVSQLS